MMHDTRCSASRPHLEGVYRRERLIAKLRGAADVPLVIVAAPAGYGKTTAVSDYLDSLASSGAEAAPFFAWVALTELDDNPSRFRRSLAGALHAAFPDAPAVFEAFHGTDLFSGFTAWFDSLEGVDSGRPLYLVFDDYHLIGDEAIHRFAGRLVELRLPGLRLFVLSRTLPPFSLAAFHLKKLAVRLTREDLQFTGEETAGWLAARGVFPSGPTRDAAGSLLRRTDGWISAMILHALSEDASVPAGADISNLFEREVFSRCEPELQAFLLGVCCLDEHPIDVCAAVSGVGASAARYFARIAEVNLFVRPGTDRKSYHIHHLFRDFLREKYMLNDPEGWIDAQVGAGDRFMEQGDPIAAAAYYCRAGRHEKVIEAMACRLADSRHASDRDEGALRLRYIESVPLALLRGRAPLVEIFYVVTLFERRLMEKCLAHIAGMKAHYEPLPPSETRDRLLGELAVVEGYMAFNDIRAMGEAFLRAWSLLRQGSAIVPSSSPVTLGSPSMLFLYHSEPGCLDEIVAHYGRGAETYARLFNGATAGMNELLRGELAYERDDFETALALSLEAEALAKEQAQRSAQIAAVFLRMQIAIAWGDYGETKHAMDDIEEIVDGSDEMVLLSTADHCRAWYAGAVGARSLMPEWLARGRVDEGYTLSYGVGVEYISCFEALFENRDYARCAELIPAMSALFGQYGNRMGQIHVTIYEAMLAWHAGKKKKAGEKLFEAWSVARRDGLVMVFVERSEALLPLVRALFAPAKKDGEYGAWLERMAPRMEGHVRMVRRLRRQARLCRTDRPEDALSKREKEVYRLLREDAGRAAIAQTLGLSPNNVKAIVRRIYDKLDHAGPGRENSGA